MNVFCCAFIYFLSYFLSIFQFKPFSLIVFLLPKLPFFDFSDALILSFHLNKTYLFFSFIYSFFYIIFTFTIALLIFNKKEFL
jgi:hypothetical protein